MKKLSRIEKLFCVFYVLVGIVACLWSYLTVYYSIKNRYNKIEAIIFGAITGIFFGIGVMMITIILINYLYISQVNRIRYLNLIDKYIKLCNIHYESLSTEITDEIIKSVDNLSAQLLNESIYLINQTSLSSKQKMQLKLLQYKVDEIYNSIYNGEDVTINYSL